jgi:hypothetical protein
MMMETGQDALCLQSKVLVHSRLSFHIFVYLRMFYSGEWRIEFIPSTKSLKCIL